MTARLKILRLNPCAKLPTRFSLHAAGLDLYSAEDVILLPGKHASVKIGLSVAIPQGFYGRIAPRSGLAVNYGINVLAGVIDSDYRGEIICVLINHGETPFNISVGTRIAQLILEAIITPQPEWVENLDDTERSINGFGSTGT